MILWLTIDVFYQYTHNICYVSHFIFKVHMYKEIELLYEKKITLSEMKPYSSKISSIEIFFDVHLSIKKKWFNYNITMYLHKKYFEHHVH